MNSSHGIIKSTVPSLLVVMATSGDGALCVRDLAAHARPRCILRDKTTENPVPVDMFLLAGLGPSLVQLALGMFGLAAVLAWLLTNHWILNNLLGTCLCMSFVALVRFGSPSDLLVYLSSVCCVVRS
jgi:Signal peptide peptidase